MLHDRDPGGPGWGLSAFRVKKEAKKGKEHEDGHGGIWLASKQLKKGKYK
ncbi:MAG: hypothetical protein ACYDHX_12905 [Methanothrix sp.]